ncbi:dienelactone hydrolase family protein [Robertmurraya korlensis]|uniref:dienelactone hydrolase family protein n=1 Tax=Robertmurraya korlensis TaxID=519977 RepID=UPI00203E0105|nr:dienelactone hydrolase family protein [Robertmurraya korlensis]MCM3601024.1 dienelactone hydrolase family protein [Robertmurraya korlensis]
MIQLQKKSDTLIIVIHEIYGINEHMRSYCELLSKQSFDVICPNLLKRDLPFDYSEEEDAYQNFIENVGFTDAFHKIKDIVSDFIEEYQKIFIIGFSVGATVAWLFSEEGVVDGIVGYYGSRIRNFVELTPKCPTMLLFPQEEPSFDVDELIRTLNNKNIEVHKLNGRHGFSDPYSLNYNRISAEIAFSEMVNFIKKH